MIKLSSITVGDVSSTKVVGFVGLIVLLVQAILAQVYYLERTTCYDPAFFSFLMLDSGSLESVLGRHGSWLSQLLPWIVLKLGGTLELFLRSYSLSFILLYLAFFLITLHGLKDKVAALAMIICCTVGYHLSFYYSTAELYQGLALLCLLWALIRKLKAADPTDRMKWGAACILLTILISFYHQLLIIPLLFLIAFEILENKLSSIKPYHLIIFTVMIGWFLIRIFLFEKSAYEASRMVTLQDFKVNLPLIGDLPSTTFFKEEIGELPALTWSVLFAVGLLLFRKRFLQTVLLIAACSGFLVLILITDHAGQSPVMYENYYTVFGFFAAVAIASSLYKLSGKIQALTVGSGVVALLIAGLIQINNGHIPFTVLVDHVDKTTTRMMNRGIHKGLVHLDNHPWYFSWMAWSMPFSSALISAVNNNSSAATIYPCTDPKATLAKNAGENVFLGPQWDDDWFTSDKLYNGIRIPNGSYRILTTEAESDSANRSIREQVKLDTIAGKVTAGSGPETFIPIRISNSSPDTLHSRLPGNGMLRIFYWIDHGNDNFEPMDQFTPIDTDIYPGETVQTYLIVDRPLDNGELKIRFDLCSDSSFGYWGLVNNLMLRK